MLLATLGGGAGLAEATGPVGVVPPLTPDTTPPALRHARLRNDGQYAIEPPPWLLMQIGRLQNAAIDAPDSLVQTMAADVTDPKILDAVVGHGVVRRVPFVWRSFFASAIVTVGRETDAGFRIGFHNPIADVSLLMQWADATTRGGRGGRLVAMEIVPSERLRLAGASERPSTAGDDVVSGLVRQTQETLDAFYRVDADPRANGRATGTDADRETALLRVVDQVSMLMFADEAPFQRPVHELLTVLRRGTEPQIAAAHANAGMLAKRLMALPTPVRQQFALLAFVPVRSGALVMLGLPGGARWLLMGVLERGSGPQPVVGQLALVDLTLPIPRPGRAP